MSFRFDFKTGRMRILPPRVVVETPTTQDVIIPVVEPPKVEEPVAIEVPVVETEVTEVPVVETEVIEVPVVETEVPVVEEDILDIEDAPVLHDQDYEY